MQETYIPWVAFLAHIILLIVLDIFVFNRKNHEISNKQAVIQTAFFVCNALIFGGFIYYFYQSADYFPQKKYTGISAFSTYLTGYLIELSLSVDNLFVIALIFKNYKTPKIYQHKLLFLGIIGAFVFRASLIFLGIFLINQFKWITIIFGLFLIYTAFKILKEENNEEVIEEADVLTKSKFHKWFRFTNTLDGDKFMTIENGKKVFTVLFATLMAIELTDLVFALDSVPAIFAITTDSFLVFSSNIFAILGLRALYFLLANSLDKFHYLKYSVFSILLLVAVKLILLGLEYFDFHILPIPTWFSLSFIVVSLLSGIFYSLFKNQ